jgi:hypothetical protein
MDSAHPLDGSLLVFVVLQVQLPDVIEPFSLPLDDVSQLPGILVKLPLQLAFLVDDELRGREENSAALALIFIVQVDFAGSQTETLRLRIPIRFAKGNLAISDKADGSPGRRQNFPDVAKVVPERAGDRYSAYALHLLKRIYQPIVLALLECLDQDVPVLGAREFINYDFHAEVSSQLSACAKGCGVDGFGLSSLPRGRNARDHEQTY